MDGQVTVFFSNRLEPLFEHLKENLFAHSRDPFSERMLIVPSRPLESWVLKKLAEELKIACGLTSSFLQEGIDRLIAGLFVDPLGKGIGELGLFFRIYEESEALLQHYIAGKEKKRVSLARALSRLFARYGIYGEPKEGWQKELWQQVLGESSYPIKRLKALVPKNGPTPDLAVHLFSFSHIPGVYADILERVAKKVPVYIYHLSFCQEFWSDLQTQKELLKQRLTEKNLAFLEETFVDTHPLLAHLGKVGRSFARLVEERDWESREAYVTLEEKSQLQKLQADLLFLRRGEKHSQDHSIQLHRAPGRYREVEALYHTVLKLIEEEKINPGEILVMAPDIALYEPFIRAFFRGRLDYQILDLPLPVQSSVAKGLLQLLTLEEKRWSVPAFLALFGEPAFLKMQGWGEKEVETIQRWVSATKIRWGYDGDHRARLLKLNKPPQGSGTWKEGLERLFERLALPEERDLIDFKEAPLLGELASLLEELHDDLTPLVDGTLKTPAEWGLRLQELVERYLTKSDEELIAKIEAFFSLPCTVSLPFSALQPLFVGYLAEELTALHPTHLSAPRFCSMLPMRSIPADAICILGMEEGAFPRRAPFGSLDLLNKNPEVPSPADLDYNLFLESVIAARRFLILSTPGTTLSTAVHALMAHVTPLEVSHPSLPFDPSYFEGKESYDVENFQIASQTEASPTYFLPEFFIVHPKREAELPSGHHLVSVAELTRLVRYPLRHFLQKRVGLRFKDEEQESWLIERKERALLKKELLRKTHEEVREGPTWQRAFPQGPLEGLAHHHFALDVAETEKNLALCSLSKNELSTVQLLFGQRELVYEKGVWKTPPVVIEAGAATFHVVGKIEGVTKRGLYSGEKSDLNGVLAKWPAFLVLNCIEGLAHGELIGRDGKSKERFFDSAKELLLPLLRYRFVAEKEPSPLYPDWIEPFLKGDEELLAKKLEEGLRGRFGRVADPERSWALAANELPRAPVLMQRWGSVAQDLYGRLYDAWF